MARKRNQSETPPEAQPQQQPRAHEVRIRTLYDDQEHYDYRDTQRGKVWPLHFKRALIDSILRGLPVPPLITRTQIVDGEEKHFVIDGQQRITAVFEFREGLFTTATEALNRKSEPGSLPPIQPGKRWGQLSAEAQKIFNSYTFVIHELDENVSDEVEGLIFRRLQNQVPLSTAEKLASYQSKTRSLAIDLQDHPVWEEIYSGSNVRRQTFQGSLCLVAIEMTEGFASLTAPRLREYAAGLKDNDLKPQLRDMIEGRLEVLMHVFKDTVITHWAEIVPMYQAILLLEQHGHKFTSSDEGCLTPWFAEIQEEAQGERGRGYTNPLVKLLYTNTQREFWEDHLPSLVEQCKRKVDSAA